MDSLKTGAKTKQKTDARTAKKNKTTTTTTNAVVVVRIGCGFPVFVFISVDFGVVMDVGMAWLCVQKGAVRDR